MPRRVLSRWIDAVALYRDRRMVTILLLGFASGLPLLLTLSTLSVWLKESGVTKTTIGLFALVGTPYAFKFLWAPLVDRLRLPLFTALLGRRRGWMVATQLALMAALVALGASDPLVDPWTTALAALVVAFCSASQDIVIDAYRVEVLDERQYGAGAAMIVFGYRIGLLVAGAGALYLASYLEWFAVYLIMAALVLVGTGAILFGPEPEAAPGSAGDGAARVGWAAIVAWIRQAVIAPFADFMTRGGWAAILVFVILYKLGDSLAGIMANPFYLELGFTKIEIANVSKLFGLAATLLGGFVGGVLVGRRGIMTSLMICGVLQMLSNLMFAVQALVGQDIAMLTLTIGVENLTGGMGTAAFVAYLSRLCSLSFTATQYALLSALTAVPRTMISSSGGWLADNLDWVSFFLLTTAAAVPGLLLLAWLMRNERRSPTVAGAGGAL